MTNQPEQNKGKDEQLQQPSGAEGMGRLNGEQEQQSGEGSRSDISYVDQQEGAMDNGETGGALTSGTGGHQS